MRMKKEALCMVVGTVGSFIASLFGGWDTGIGTLVLFMVIDFLSGLAVAGIFKRSTKTETGALESKAGFKGLCRKGIANELISIVENAGLMGLPLPAVLIKAIDVLKKKAEVTE